MTMRQVFYSFHYRKDNWRASQVRNIGVVKGNSPAIDNDWEAIKEGGESSIKRWIDSQMQNRSCTVVLIGSQTANRDWINYEICQSWIMKMGLVGIYVHGLEDKNGEVATKGHNPFDYLVYKGIKLSAIFRCYDPPGKDSNEKFRWIQTNLSAIIEESITIRSSYHIEAQESS